MKIELELPDKPEVHAIAGMLNLDTDSVVGKLIRVWQWFDKHTTDGNAYGVTFALCDRVTGVTGFGEAMAFVGWLEQQDKFLQMPKFDRHTSESAKARALAAKRQSQYRNKSNADDNATGNVKSNANGVTSPSQREEKRSKPPISPDGFDAFWSAYPRKVSKGDAQKAWRKQSPDLHAVLKAIERDRATDQWRKDGGEFIPYPATWLNKRRWEDETSIKVRCGEENPYDRVVDLSKEPLPDGMVAPRGGETKYYPGIGWCL